MVKIYDEIKKDSMEMRKSYAQALIDAAKANEKILVMDCDLANSVGTKPFYEAFPDRGINCGIEEGNACGVAAGLSATGFVPFLHSFGVFSSRKMVDQIFLSCAYAKQNVKIVGGDAGVSAAFNGGTHMAFEDIGVLRSIPEVTILDVADGVQIKDLVPKIANTYGVFYLRMPRKSVMAVYEPGSTFEIGKGVVCKEGSDVSIFTCGIMVAEALEAAKILEKEGISAEVIDMFTIKPIDEDLVVKSTKKTGCAVTCDNHNVIGGLASAVAEVLCAKNPSPLERVGVEDEFGMVGQQSFLQERYKLTAKDIVEKAKIAVSRK